MSANTVLYTRPHDEYRVHGYWHEGKARAIVSVDGIEIEAHGADDLLSMERLADALRDAVAQAREARASSEIVAMVSS